MIFKGQKFTNIPRIHKLIEGDIIKIGRVILLVKEIRINKPIWNIKDKENPINIISFQDSKSIKEEEISGNNNHEFTRGPIKISRNLCRTLKLQRRKNKDSKNETIYNDLTSDKLQQKNNNSTSQPLHLKINHSLNIESNGKKPQKEKKKKICRICYCEENESDYSDEEYDNNINPLIQPCSCSGSMKYIHLKCLKKWLSSKILVESPFINSPEYMTSYYINNIQCELCQENLPDQVKYKGKVFDLLDFDSKAHINDNIIIFDTLSLEKNDERYRHIVKFDESNKITIGRGIEAQMILNDISVSRMHCILTLCKGNKILMEDYNSKFGSLVLLQCPSIEIMMNNYLNIQVGRSYMILELQKPFGLFNCCCVNDFEIKETYEMINRRFIEEERSIDIKELSDSDDEDESSDEEVDNIKKKLFLMDESEERKVFLKVIPEESLNTHNSNNAGNGILRNNEDHKRLFNHIDKKRRKQTAIEDYHELENLRNSEG